MDQQKILKHFSAKRIMIPIIIGLGVSGIMIMKDIKTDQLSADILSASFSWVLMAFIFMLVKDLANLIRLRLLTDKKISFRDSVQVIVLWEFATAVTPAFIGGSAIALFIINREGVNMGKSTAVVMITALLDELFFLIGVPVIFLLSGYQTHFIHLDNLPYDIGTKGMFFAGYLFMAFLTATILTGVFISPKGFKRIIVWIFKLPGLSRWKAYAKKTGNEIIETSREMRKRSVFFWVKAFLVTAVSWSAKFFIVLALIQAFQPGDQFLEIYGRQMIMWVILLISPTPGGSGVAEYFFPQFLGEFMKSGTEDFITFIWRFLTYYPYLIAGAIVLPFWLRRVLQKKKAVR